MEKPKITFFMTLSTDIKEQLKGKVKLTWFDNFTGIDMQEYSQKTNIRFRKLNDSKTLLVF